MTEASKEAEPAPASKAAKPAPAAKAAKPAPAPKAAKPAPASKPAPACVAINPVQYARRRYMPGDVLDLPEDVLEGLIASGDAKAPDADPVAPDAGV